MDDAWTAKPRLFRLSKLAEYEVYKIKRLRAGVNVALPRAVTCAARYERNLTGWQANITGNHCL
jgi:hypothetical protein